MTEPRQPLRLVGSPSREDEHESESESDFDALDRAPHDLHPPYRELVAVEDTGANDDPPRTPLSARFVIVGLIVFQLLAASTFIGKYSALTQGEDQFKVAACLSVVASLCLVVGAVLLALKPGRGRALFIVAATAFGLSLPAWGVGYGWTWPMAFGAMLALAGAWFARAEVRPDEASAAQP